MLGQSVRLVVAILTFTTGIAIVRVLELIPRLETAVVDRFVSVSEIDVAPVALSDPAQDANEIYRLVIQRNFLSMRDREVIVVQAETTGFPMYEKESFRKEEGLPDKFHQLIKKNMPEVQPQTLDNYLVRNLTSQPLEVSDLGNFYYVLVTKTDLPDDGFEGFWTKFYQKYPNSSWLLFFSNIGFNVQRDQAFLYAGRSCGGLCGSGEYVLLSKVNGKWEIQTELGLWVS